MMKETKIIADNMTGMTDHMYTSASRSEELGNMHADDMKSNENIDNELNMPLNGSGY